MAMGIPHDFDKTSGRTWQERFQVWSKYIGLTSSYVGAF